MKAPSFVHAALSAVIILLGACQKAPQITISTPVSIDISSDGSSGTITFMANRDWTVSCSESWIQVNPVSGPASKRDPVTVSYRCDPNQTYDDRTATVTIRAEDAVQAVTVRQPQKLGIIVPSEIIEIEAETKSFEVEIQANVGYNVWETASWLTFLDTKGLKSEKLVFSAEENTSADEREAWVTLMPNDESIQPPAFKVRQAAKSFVEIDKTEYEMKVDGGTLEVAVRTNVELDVKPEVAWIHFDQTKALSDKTVVLTVDKNEGSEKRTGKVTISNKNGSVSSTISVKQYGSFEGAVDMGLSVYWAECNLGARTPEGFGDYFAWGETEVKDTYSWKTYKWCKDGDKNKLTKYCPSDKAGFWGGAGSPDGKTEIDPEDDVVHSRLGGKWHIPTDEEWVELMMNCTWTWTPQNGTFGYLVVSNITGNSIFLPATGFMNGNELMFTGQLGRYWSSSLPLLPDSSPSYAWFMNLNEDAVGRGTTDRYDGNAIRPVTK